MYKILIISIIALLANVTVKGQNLFLIVEKSYPSTNPIKLESNADYGYGLDLFFAKEGKSGLVGVSKKCLSGERFAGELIIYLEDGSVLTCNESEVSERVGDRAKAVYPLTEDQLNKLKISNIHTVKYTLVLFGEVIYSASNTGIKTNAIISDFFGTGHESNGIEKSTESPKDTTRGQETYEEPFMYVEQMPTFPGGQEAMYTYLYKELEYPALAKENGVSGTVIVQFVVSKEGEIQKPKVARSLGDGCNEESLRIVSTMPKWNPAMHNGRTVPVTFTLPIKFTL